MRQLPLSNSQSFFLSVQIALDANGIPYTSSGSPLGWNMGPATQGDILVDDADYDRALEAIRDLQETHPESIGDAYRSRPSVRAVVIPIVSGIVWLWFEFVFGRLGRR